MRILAVGCFAMLAGLPAGMVRGQSSVDAEVGRYQEALEKLARPVVESYLADLTAFEAAAVEREDYEAAGEAHARRIEVEEYLEIENPDLEAWKEKNAIVLPMPAPRLSGPLAYDKRTRRLGRWKNLGSAARWDPLRFAPGDYQVEIVYSCGEVTVETSNGRGKRQAGGTIEFREISGLLDEDANTLVHRVRKTDDWDTTRTVRIGEMSIRSRSPRFRLSALDVLNEAVLELVDIRFIPRRKGPVVSLQSDWEELQTRYRTARQRKLEPLQRDYRQRLEAIEEAARAGGDGSLATEVRRTIEAIGRP